MKELFYLSGNMNPTMWQRVFHVLHKGVRTPLSGLESWGRNEDGFFVLAFYLSFVLVALSTIKRVQSSVNVRENVCY